MIWAIDSEVMPILDVSFIVDMLSMICGWRLRRYGVRLRWRRQGIWIGMIHGIRQKYPWGGSTGGVRVSTVEVCIGWVCGFYRETKIDISIKDHIDTYAAIRSVRVHGNDLVYVLKRRGVGVTYETGLKSTGGTDFAL